MAKQLARRLREFQQELQPEQADAWDWDSPQYMGLTVDRLSPGEFRLLSFQLSTIDPGLLIEQDPDPDASRDHRQILVASSSVGLDD